MGVIKSKKRIVVHFQPAVCVCISKWGGLGVQFPYIYHTLSVLFTIHSYFHSCISLLSSLSVLPLALVLASGVQVAMAAVMQVNTLHDVASMLATVSTSLFQCHLCGILVSP
jgi:hypothetical protein